MARYDWNVVRAVVEEEICFKNEESFEHYLTQLAVRNEPYHVADKKYEYGRIIATIRKRYGEYSFIGNSDEPINPEQVRLFKEFETCVKCLKDSQND